MPIIDRRTRLKARRAFRKQKRQVEAVTANADDNINKHVIRRFGRLVYVRRFVALWTLLVLMLGFGALWQVRGMDKFYLETSPVSGGIYREGIIGTFTNLNPLFATSSVDASVSRLVFSGLLKVSPKGVVEPDLASDYKIEGNGKTYIVNLRNDVVWQDDQKFDADDVVFTYKTIQNADARSPLKSSWSGVEVTKISDYQVKFELPSALSSFIYSLTNGIVPEHVLSDVSVADLRSSNFNTIKPVGTGPYVLKTLEVTGNDAETRQERIALTKSANYFGNDGGPSGVVINSYRDEESMTQDFDQKIIQSMVGLDSVPEEITSQEDVTVISAPLTSSVNVFLNNSSVGLSEAKVRQALVSSVDVDSIRDSLSYDAVPVDSPFLRSHFAYDKSIVQLPYDKAKATTLLDEAGWVLNDKKMRIKDGKELKLRLVSQSLSEYSETAKHLQKAWLDIGVQVEAVLQPEEDIQAGVISRHDYDVLLYGISVGYDPDVFAYWHSTQADVNALARLNFSEYKSATADEALEAGRTRTDEELRKIKYKPFLQSWQADAPAIALYQPRFVMVVRGTFDGFQYGQLGSAVDRFYSISDWKIRNAEVVK
jgi:peptide/nickel transport system substrate-binding protein